MTITVSGSAATQSGSDTSLGTAIDSLTGLNVVDGWLRVMPDGSSLTVNGTLTDATGNFALMLLGTAKFGTSSTGSITIGTRSLVGGKPVYSGGGTLVLKPGAAESPFGEGNINYALGDNTGTSTSGNLSLFDTSVIAFSLTDDARTSQFVSDLAGCSFRAINQGGGGSQFTNLRLQAGAIFDDNVIENVYQFEFHGQPASFARNRFINTYGFINYSTGVLVVLDNIQFTGTVANAGLTMDGGLYYVNTYKDGVEMTEAFIDSLQPSDFFYIGIGTNTNESLHGIHWGKTHRELIKNPSGTALTTARVYFKDSYTTPNVYLPTVTGGAYTQTIKLKRATSSSIDPVTYASYYPVTKLVTQYNSVPYLETFASYDAFVAHTTQQTRVLPVDTNVSNTSESAANGILASYFTVNTSTNTIGVTGAATLDMMYDALKAWKNKNIQANLEYLGVGNLIATAAGTTLDCGAMNITGLQNLSQGTKFKTLKTTGAVTASGAFAVPVVGNVSQATPTNLSNASLTGDLTYNTSSTAIVTLTDFPMVGTISNSGSGTILVKCKGTTRAATITAGSHVTVQQAAPFTAPNLLSGSTVMLINTATDTVLDQTILTAPGYSVDVPWTSDIELTLRVSKLGYLPIVADAIITINGATILNAQAIDAEYVNNGIDGTTVTECSTDYAHIEVDIDEPAPSISVQRIYAWIRAEETTYNGLHHLVESMYARNSASYRVNVAVANLKIRNMRPLVPLMITGGTITCSDGTSIIASGVNNIQIDPGEDAFIANSDAIAAAIAAVPAAVWATLLP